MRAAGVLGGGVRNVGAGTGALAPAQALSENYYANIYVYACIRAIATDLAARPFRVGADPEAPNDYDPNHPLARRLSPPPGGPNVTTTARRLFAWSAAQRLVFGALAWEIVPSDLSFWPLTATNLNPIRQDKTNLIPRTGWYKEFEVGDGRTKKVLKPERVFYSWNPAQDDWGRPESALQAARLDIQVAVMQDIYDNAFLRNDSRPAAIVVHQAFDTDEDKVKFRRQFLNRHQGPQNAGRTAFVEANPQVGGAAPKDSIFVQTLGLSQRDAQAIERYDAKLRSICVAFGVPLSRLGDASKRTFSNADRETLNYWLDTVQPLGLDIADDINLKLMPLFDNSGNVGWFDWTGVPDLVPSKRFTVGEVITMRRDGLITDEEAREEIGMPTDVELPGLPDADDVDVPAEPAPAPAVEAQALTPRDVADMLDGLAERLTAEMRAAPNLAGLPIETSHAPTLDELAGIEVLNEARARYEFRRAQWGRTDKAVRREEAKWERRFQELLDAQEKAVLSRLTGKRGRQAFSRAADDGEDAVEVVADEVFDTTFWEKQTSKLFGELYEDTTASALVQFDAQFNISFDVDDPAFASFVDQRTNKLSGQVTSTTYRGIQDALKAGVADGESIPDLASRIEHLFQQTYANRATTVARTEVISAYNGSTAVAARESDLVVGLEWIATLDDRVRDDHAALDGTIIAPGESFELDDGTVEYPGDPNAVTDVDPGSMIINCRCTCAPVVAEDDGDRAVPYSVARLALIAAASQRVVPAAPVLELSPPDDTPARASLGELVINVKTGAAKHVVQRDENGRIIGLMEVDS